MAGTWRARFPAVTVVTVATALLVQPGCGGNVQEAASQCGDAIYLDALAEAADRVESLAAGSRQRLATRFAAIAGEPIPDAPSADDVVRLCDAARARIEAEFAAASDPYIAISPGTCRVSHEGQLACDRRCAEAARCECDVGTVESRCEPGHLGGACAGSCDGTCLANVGGSVECNRWCSGICNGSCDGTCSERDDAGDCAGHCDGACTGSCDGACEVAGESCNGTCLGTCDVELSQTFCEGALSAPTCDCPEAAACFDACGALSSLNIACDPPAVTLTASGPLDPGFTEAFEDHFPDVMRFLVESEAWLPAAHEVAAAIAQLEDSPEPACADRVEALRARFDAVRAAAADFDAMFTCFVSVDAGHVSGS